MHLGSGFKQLFCTLRSISGCSYSLAGETVASSVQGLLWGGGREHMGQEEISIFYGSQTCEAHIHLKSQGRVLEESE